MESGKNAHHSKSVLLHEQLRRALRSGRYRPGQRIDPAALATEFRTSPTPVRSALYKLVGEGLLEDHARNGLHVPLPTEIALRDLYDWMQRLLLMACDIRITTAAKAKTELDPAAPDTNIVQHTWQLFDTIAHATTHRSLHQTVQQTNDRLAPIRSAKQGLLLQHSAEEFSELNQHWQDRNFRRLRPALRIYQDRRKQIVPQIFALLRESSNFR